MFIAKYTACAAPSAFGISPDGGDKRNDTASVLFLPLAHFSLSVIRAARRVKVEGSLCYS